MHPVEYASTFLARQEGGLSLFLSRAPWLLPAGAPVTKVLAITRHVVHAMVAVQATAKLQLKQKLRLKRKLPQMRQRQLRQGWRDRRFRATPHLLHTSPHKGLFPVHRDSGALKTPEESRPRLGLRDECDVDSTSAT